MLFFLTKYSLKSYESKLFFRHYTNKYASQIIQNQYKICKKFNFTTLLKYWAPKSNQCKRTFGNSSNICERKLVANEYSAVRLKLMNGKRKGDAGESEFSHRQIHCNSFSK